MGARRLLDHWAPPHSASAILVGTGPCQQVSRELPGRTRMSVLSAGHGRPAKRLRVGQRGARMFESVGEIAGRPSRGPAVPRFAGRKDFQNDADHCGSCALVCEANDCDNAVCDPIFGSAPAAR